MDWRPWRWRKKRVVFSRLESQDLDLLMLPQYSTPVAEQQQQRHEVEQLIEAAGKDSFDAGTREFLNNYINGAADKAVAELGVQRDDALALADAHVALATEKVALYGAPYEADLARVSQAANALAVTFEDLTGRPAQLFVPPAPRRVTQGPVVSTLGPIDISDDTEIHVDADETAASESSEDIPDLGTEPPAAPPRVEDDRNTTDPERSPDDHH